MPAKDHRTGGPRKAPPRRTKPKYAPETPYESIKRQAANLKRRAKALDKERSNVHDKYRILSDDEHDLSVQVCEMVGLLDTREVKKVYEYCQMALARDA